MPKLLFLIAALLIAGCGDKPTSESTERENFLAGKKLYLLDKGNPIGWTIYNPDKTFVEDDGQSGTYELDSLLLSMYFPGFRVKVLFPRKEVEKGDLLQATFFQSALDSIVTEFEVFKFEDNN